MLIEVAIGIAAAPPAVFALLADIRHWPEWASQITELTVLTPGPIAVGTCYRETRTMQGRTVSQEITIQELQPPVRFVTGAITHGTRFAGVHRVEPDGVGSRLVVGFLAQPVTLSAALIHPLMWLMRGRLRRQIERDLADFKRAAEQQPGDGV